MYTIYNLKTKANNYYCKKWLLTLHLNLSNDCSNFSSLGNKLYSLAPLKNTDFLANSVLTRGKIKL